ncbi:MULTISPECIES: SpoIIE family protein phosphatase [unclassified Isoptericola]|uniref:SpoIIE family protein phosphatase n=1 Tax=unclassified Isoptericola TaxID=2623355 RepID=UPI002713519B|nr:MULTISPECIES: SpoIIE family protein phosphatase [unclassified Isoptericola]MDO8145700.1 SpoIIE family protein phosphatase [Isoptericola sp. 178]MDO8149757.1 SpoIIE family protein phosphatase [Isoptericola sp. b515]MDO8152058.1 SpoIIE family protein phosphatase [Isoptericola sp. b408]
MLESGAWYTVDHPSAVGRVRRAAVTTAIRLGHDESRAAEVGLVVSELATNQTRHAGSGRMLLAVDRTDGCARLTVLAVDSGPGMRDVAAAMRDGVSSRGTLGIGLGTLPRLAGSWDAWSAPGAGTVVSAAFDARRPVAGDERPASTAGAPSGITRAMTGQQVCGDAFAVRVDDGASSVLVADGLGHGPLAAAASQAAVRAFRAAPAAGPAILLERVHRALAGTRGAAVAVVQQIGSTLRHAGIGNIAGAIHGTRTRSLLSPPGIGGSRSPAISETTHAVSEGDVVTLYSDGLTDRVNLVDYPGLLLRSATVVAGVIMRDFAVRRDDACVVVLPVRGATRP